MVPFAFSWIGILPREPAMLDRRFSVAPMMDWTDSDDRFFLRLCSARALLYTEMVPTQALWHGRAERFLAYNREEHPVALQIGGSDPEQAAYSARLAQAWGYDEININVGCPSDRVQSGRFGACLMAEPALVADLVGAMRASCALDVTVKTRIGIDDMDDYEDLARFVDTVAGAGCRTFIIHARKAWLQGLSPKENREIPPLHPDRVHALKRDFPQQEIIINGGIRTLDESLCQLGSVDGVMMGREAYQNPYLLTDVDARIFGADASRRPTRHELVEAYLPHVQRRLDQGVRLSRMTRHIIGLFQGLPGARQWRRHLSENAPRPGAGVEVIERAAELVPREVADSAA